GAKHPLFLVLKSAKSTVKEVVQENLKKHQGYTLSYAYRATKKVMLILDDFSAHFTEEVVAYAESLNVVLERVPPRFT
ncbi:hypothetical protein H310_15069, partial [Aphanomyces invadans]